MAATATERLPGAAALVIGLAFCILARRLPAQTGFGLGPAFLPFWTGALLSLCGAWLAIRPGKQSEGETPAEAGSRRVAFGLFILLLYALALEPLGYLLSTLGFLFGYLRFLYKASSARALSVAFTSGLILFLIFRVWLRVPLPAGFLGW
jgi:putative tricarboxylic transport membrane protein